MAGIAGLGHDRRAGAGGQCQDLRDLVDAAGPENHGRCAMKKPAGFFQKGRNVLGFAQRIFFSDNRSKPVQCVFFAHVYLLMFAGCFKQRWSFSARRNLHRCNGQFMVVAQQRAAGGH